MLLASFSIDFEPPFRKIESVAFRVSRFGRRLYGVRRKTASVTPYGKKSWPVCRTFPPAETWTWMCTVRPEYHPG